MVTVMMETFKCARCGWMPRSKDRLVAASEVTVHLSLVHHLPAGVQARAVDAVDPHGEAPADGASTREKISADHEVI